MNLYVKWDEIENFAFKIILFKFLEANKNIYELSESEDYLLNTNDSFKNIFTVYNLKTHKQEIIIFFNYYTTTINKYVKENNLSNDIKITVYYLDNASLKSSNVANKHINIVLLDENIKSELLKINKDNFLEIIVDYSQIDLFMHIMNKYRFNDVANKKEDKIYYKYKGIEGCKVKEMIDGEFTYVNPIKFNDPFDCDFNIIDFGSNNKKQVADLKSMFRVLSLTPIMDSILMWGYYANNHNGVAVGHTLNDYISSTNIKYNGLVIYGDIRYTDIRPKYKMDKRYLKFLTFIDFLNKVVDCCFTKFTDRKHEKEFRILTFESGFNKRDFRDKNFMEIKGKTSSVYVGVNYTGGLKLPLNYKKLEKDNKIYKLNIM